MSDVHVDAVAMRISPDAATFASLPLSLAHRIFLALPVDARLCASYVYRAWRDTLAEPSLWTRLSMSGMHVERRRFFDRMLRSLARRERDQICQLDLSQEDFKESVPLPLLTANAGSLRELHLHSIHPNWSDTTKATFGVVVKAAPLLQVLKVENVRCLLKDALKMLRAEPPYAPLQMSRSLEVYFQDERGELDCGMNRFGRFAPFAAALADATLQPALSRLCVFAADVSPPAVMGALVDAVRVRQLRELALEYGMPPAAAQLVRLLAEGSLAVLEINQPYRQVFAAAGAALVADALRSNTTLTALHLRGVHLCVDMDAAELVLGALVGHLSLRELWIIYEDTTDEDCIVFGAALAALIAADAPALQVLVCKRNELGDDGLAPIVGALALNRHLHTLDVGDNGMSEDFARERLLPAVRTNTTLRKLKCGTHRTESPAAAEAEELVRRRGQHD
jgi:hypothetical protein